MTPHSMNRGRRGRMAAIMGGERDFFPITSFEFLDVIVVAGGPLAQERSVYDVVARWGSRVHATPSVVAERTQATAGGEGTLHPVYFSDGQLLL